MFRLFALFALLALCACGGGGNTNDAPVNTVSLKLNPDPVTAEYFQYEVPVSGISFDASLNGAVSNPAIYVLVKDDANTFATSAAKYMQTAQYSFSMNLPFRSGIRTGIHAGHVSIRVCNDAKCHSLVASGSLPYTATIKANPTPAISGFPLSPFNRSAIQGTSVDLALTRSQYSDTQLYVAISDSSELLMPAAPIPLMPSGCLSCTATIPINAGYPDGVHSGTLKLTLCGDTQCKVKYDSKSLAYNLTLVSIFGGLPGAPGYTEGSSANSRFKNPSDATLDAMGNLYVADTNNHAVRKITAAGVASTISASGLGSPRAIEINPSGLIYVLDGLSGAIRTIASDGTQSIFGDSSCLQQGVAGMAIGADGNAYVSDEVSTVYKINSGGCLGLASVFDMPIDLLPDNAGNLYVADSGNGAIRKINLADNSVSTFVGTPGSPSNDVDGDAATARFLNPNGLAFDGSGNLYVAEIGGAVRKIAPNGTTTTVLQNLTLPNGQPMNPVAVALTPGGTMYIVDRSNSVILRTKVE